jgi:molybdenum cofactor biosynthesis enzyme MoaA
MAPNTKLFLEDIQFYITNACNLTCDNCITYNNYKFKGHYYFKDHAEYYREWSKKINFERISFIGGEPFANPELFTWYEEIKKLWPSCEYFFVNTNGTYLKNNIDKCKDYLKQGLQYDVSVHDDTHYQEIKSNLEEILSVYDNVKTIKIDDTNIEYEYNGKLISSIKKRYFFGKNSLAELKNRVIYMHNSDPAKSHGPCGTCHTAVRGKIHKCFLTAIGEDLTQQFSVDERSKNLLLSYQPSSPFDSDSKIQEFLNTIKTPIDQCKLCPEEKSSKKIWPLSLKKVDI